MTKIRFAGAQIPIHDEDIQYNKKEIFKALDWAKENNVDVIQTPEACLSGYGAVWQDKIDELMEALKDVEDYQKKCGVALNLGTCILSIEQQGFLKRNQIRHYHKDGSLYSVTNKTYIVQADINCVPSFTPVAKFDTPFAGMTAVGMICNDMWGSPQEQGTDFKPIKSLNELVAVVAKPDIIFHSTNAFSFPEIEDDDKEWKNGNLQQLKNIEHQFPIRELMDSWSEAWLRMTAFRSSCSILTVDCATHWGWVGNEEVIDKCKTSSPSGFLNHLGEWQTDVPRYGRQYFYHDYTVDRKRPKAIIV